jgi:hypothetical protein
MMFLLLRRDALGAYMSEQLVCFAGHCLLTRCGRLNVIVVSPKVDGTRSELLEFDAQPAADSTSTDGSQCTLRRVDSNSSSRR